MVLNCEAPVFQTAQQHASRPTTWRSLSCCLRWNELSCVGGGFRSWWCEGPRFLPRAVRQRDSL